MRHGPSGPSATGIPGPTRRWAFPGDGWCVSTLRRISAAFPASFEGARLTLVAEDSRHCSEAPQRPRADHQSARIGRPTWSWASLPSVRTLGSGEGMLRPPSNPRPLAPLPEQRTYGGAAPEPPHGRALTAQGAPLWSPPASKRAAPAACRRWVAAYVAAAGADADRVPWPRRGILVRPLRCGPCVCVGVGSSSWWRRPAAHASVRGARRDARPVPARNRTCGAGRGGPPRGRAPGGRGADRPASGPGRRGRRE